MLCVMIAIQLNMPRKVIPNKDTSQIKPSFDLFFLVLAANIWISIASCHATLAIACKAKLCLATPGQYKP